MDGWIGVDLDGTLAEYHGWNGGIIGAPIPLMVERVKLWRANGIPIRIFTARVCVPIDQHTGRATVEVIQEWCLEHLGEELPVTNIKDFGMIQLWDDRAVQVESNTGKGCDQYPNQA